MTHSTRRHWFYRLCRDRDPEFFHVFPLREVGVYSFPTGHDLSDDAGLFGGRWEPPVLFATLYFPFLPFPTSERQNSHDGNQRFGNRNGQKDAARAQSPLD